MIKTFRKKIFAAEYLAVIVSVAAFSVSLYQPLSDLFSGPKLEVILPVAMTATTNLGIVELTPFLAIVNDGNAPGSVAEIKCSLTRDEQVQEMRAATFNLPDGTGNYLGKQVIGAVSLNISEEFMNPVNCLSETYSTDLEVIDRHAELRARAGADIQRLGGVDCKRQWFERRPVLNVALARDLEAFFDENFSLTVGDYEFEVSIANAKREIVASDRALISISESMIQRLNEQRELLQFGFGTVCPLGAVGLTEIVLQRTD
ncbi:hypothetical protein [Octadecabacter ascidiaceicola]|uniref:Uncharacterized protein n=1 Tax=Octadecabacter ascidiaceicola TaxID=1655543 RepID=A0A238K4H6_9RHOB|nr:hypothetical protein [Octadecabacter ascidiaceicola]SMX37828.1 hypothetical protein OCA8868_01579 [Octadecabacter ascidiaceicola]